VSPLSAYAERCADLPVSRTLYAHRHNLDFPLRRLSFGCKMHRAPTIIAGQRLVVFAPTPDFIGQRS
jgi:hypothetical protein